jgi:two-component system, OmpR family, sensor kinase
MGLSVGAKRILMDRAGLGNRRGSRGAFRPPVGAIGMRRVLDNLVENAVKYGNDARVRLFIDREDAVAEVSDSGPGLSDRELERVFEPFYRSPAARASGKQGSGLGLAVCRSIARAHGGDVQLRRGAQGMVAQMRLPLAIRFATVD